MSAAPIATVVVFDAAAWAAERCPGPAYLRRPAVSPIHASAAIASTLLSGVPQVTPKRARQALYLYEIATQLGPEFVRGLDEDVADGPAYSAEFVREWETA